MNKTAWKDAEHESPQGEGDRMIGFMFRHFLSLGWHVRQQLTVKEMQPVRPQESARLAAFLSTADCTAF